MKIKEITWRHRRDFKAIFVCEHCSHEEEMHGYDDANFHKNVIPKFKCESCEQPSPDNYEPMQTKYPEGMEV